MTRQILILIYILMVLALSGAVKAASVDQTTNHGHGLVSSVKLDVTTGIVTVHGVLATPCDSKPMIVINKIDPTKNIIEFDVSTTITGQGCIDTVGDEFDAALDLKDLPLIGGQTYELVFLDFDNKNKPVMYTAHPHLEGFFSNQFEKRTFHGLLVSLVSQIGRQATYALNQGTELLPVANTQMNLEKFTNKDVRIFGYISDKSVVPVVVTAH